MEKTLLNLGRLRRTVGYVPKLKTGPSTNYVVYTLTVEHIDVNITEAQNQRHVENFCDAETLTKSLYIRE